MIDQNIKEEIETERKRGEHENDAGVCVCVSCVWRKSLLFD